MRKLGILTFAAALSIAAAQTVPTTPTTGPNTTGTPDMGATTPQSHNPRHLRPRPIQGPNKTRGRDHETGTPQTGSATTTPQTDPARPTTAATHTGSTPAAANQSGVRTMPDTAAGWLPALLGGFALAGTGLSMRRFRA